MENTVSKLEALARKWHEGQTRKGPGNIPYVVHPAAVVAQLRAWGYNDEEDAVTLSVAWGHDLIEETSVPEADIVAAGGEAVLAGIKKLSFFLPKHPRLSHEERAARKGAYILDVATTAAPEILVVKMADRLCNTVDFLSTDNGWGTEYFRLGKCLFDRMGEMKHAREISARYREVLAMVENYESE